jgi:hypothetical protein
MGMLARKMRNIQKMFHCPCKSLNYTFNAALEQEEERNLCMILFNRNAVLVIPHLHYYYISHTFLQASRHLLIHQHENCVAFVDLLVGKHHNLSLNYCHIARN